MRNDRLIDSSLKCPTQKYAQLKTAQLFFLNDNKYNYFKESGDESRVPPTKVLNSAQGCNSILPREFELISKQMEPQDTSSGCWSGGSTIQGRGNTKNTGNTTLW